MARRNAQRGQSAQEVKTVISARRFNDRHSIKLASIEIVSLTWRVRSPCCRNIPIKVDKLAGAQTGSQGFSHNLRDTHRIFQSPGRIYYPIRLNESSIPFEIVDASALSRSWVLLVNRAGCSQSAAKRPGRGSIGRSIKY